MKVINTKGIIYLEHLAENSEWYCGCDHASGDLYEAEEIYSAGKTVKPNRLVFIHHPEGKMVEPLILKENQYFGRPTQINGIIYILLVDFEQGWLRILNCGNEFEVAATEVEIPLTEFEDCYNLLLRGKKLMLTRQGGDGKFEVLWPEKIAFSIGSNESFLYGDGDKLVFSRWLEDPEYREEIVIRNKMGEILEVIPGSIFVTPAGEEWILQ